MELRERAGMTFVCVCVCMYEYVLVFVSVCEHPLNISHTLLDPSEKALKHTQCSKKTAASPNDIYDMITMKITIMIFISINSKHSFLVGFIVFFAKVIITQTKMLINQQINQ